MVGSIWAAANTLTLSMMNLGRASRMTSRILRRMASKLPGFASISAPIPITLASVTVPNKQSSHPHPHPCPAEHHGLATVIASMSASSLARSMATATRMKTQILMAGGAKKPKTRPL
jgi:hypothetical protein